MSKKTEPTNLALVGEINQLLEKMNKGDPDPAAVDKVRAWLDANPTVVDKVGNLCTMTRDGIVERSFTSASTREIIMARLRHMRDNLDYDEASELERSLIEHVIMCWVRLHDCELRYSAAIAESMTLTKADWWERKLAHNQRRYLKACESLARVKRLLPKAERPNNPAFNLLLKQQLGIK